MHDKEILDMQEEERKKIELPRLPDWADAELSMDLPVLRARGENQGLEYKREFPSNARDLAKEIAAFASSNPGMILLGVADDGDLTGLADCDNSRARDALLQRLEGIMHAIRPPITPSAKFAVERAYRALFNVAVDAAELSAIRAHLQQQRALGSRWFQSTIEHKLGRCAALRPAHRPPRKGGDVDPEKAL